MYAIYAMLFGASIVGGPLCLFICGLTLYRVNRKNSRFYSDGEMVLNIIGIVVGIMLLTAGGLFGCLLKSEISRQSRLSDRIKKSRPGALQENESRPIREQLEPLSSDFPTFSSRGFMIEDRKHSPK